ncbi:MAG: chromate resistance protein [Candidatus Aminicenantes bacterium]|nr:chromate resistance protein [Candidatus Aminicenantes bacterium]
MRINQKVKNKSIEEPKEKLEWLLVLSAFFIGYFYIYVYQNIIHIEVKLLDFQTLIQMPLIAVVILPLIHYLVVIPDPLQRSPSKRKSVRFFQNEFPSKYILERCVRCIEDETSCPNYIKAESYAHIRYWFYDIFHGKIETVDPRRVRDTYEKGYHCKLLYYLSWILGVFLAFAIAIIVFHYVYQYFYNEYKVDLTSLQIIFPLVCGLIIILIKALNRPDESRPSGCWHAWREINRMHISWLAANKDYLDKLICQAGGGDKKFREKMIVTHANPDFDCIVAVWLLKRFCGMEDAEIKFMKFGEPIPSEYKGAAFVDIGEGEYDHHHRKDFVSSATLVLEKFNLKNDSVLEQLADIARQIDHGLPDERTKGFLNLINIIAGLNKLYPDDPLKVMTITFDCLDAIYKLTSPSFHFEEELKKGVEFHTKWGPGIAIETHDQELRGYCHRKGYVVFIYVDPVTQYRGYAAPGDKGVDFSDVYEKVKGLEPDAEWYLHFSKDLLICGSGKAANYKLSKLKLHELINLVKLDE